MEKDISALAQQMLGKQGSKVVASKSSELERLANSADGKKVKQMLDSNGGIENAISSGDTQSLKKALNSVLKTKEGMRLASQLSDMFNKK